MSNAGRNTKYEPDRVKRIVKAIADGNTHKVACAIGGIDPATFYRWMETHSDFCETVKKAEAEAEAFHVDRIKLHSFRNWQASAWMLERRNPEEWGKKDKVDVTSNGEKIGFLSWSDESKE